jgi:hypothetical protein
MKSHGVEVMLTDQDSDRIILQFPLPYEGSFEYLFNRLTEQLGYTTLQKTDIEKTFGHAEYGTVNSYLVCPVKLIEKLFPSRYDVF